MGYDAFIPDIKVCTVYDVDWKELKDRNIKGLIFDIDNTLVDYGTKTAGDKLMKLFNELTGSGFKMYLVSNNKEERVRGFAEPLGLSYESNALKPLSKSLKKAVKSMGILASETALIGDQVFTDVWGGNRLGMLTILVDAIADDDTRFVRFKRNLERRILSKKEW